MAPKQLESLETVVVRFAGDSGDGMQITGSQFTNTAAVLGNDLATFPDYPAEIRAPAGTLPGVSGFQVHFSATEIWTPGDQPDVLVAMNPAALKVNLKDLPNNAILICDVDAFDPRNLQKAGYEANPLDDGSLAAYRTFRVGLTSLTEAALAEHEDLTVKEKRRCKNFFALGMLYWLYSREFDTTEGWLEKKFAKKPQYARANITAMKAGYAYCDASEEFQVSYEVAPAPTRPGTYRNVSGNEATALGLVAASARAGVELFYGSYPITPASNILHELAKHKNFGVRTFQAEDEIAAVVRGHRRLLGWRDLAVTTTSGTRGRPEGRGARPRPSCWSCRIVLVDIQRGGPSTGTAHQDRAVGPAAGRVRPQRRRATVRCSRPATPGDCFFMAHRGGPHRDQVHDARSCCSPTATWPTAPSRGRSRNI